MTTKYRLLILLLPLLHFLGSCFLPTLYGEGGFLEDGEPFYGFHLLIFGWISLGLFYPFWLANPFFVLAIVALVNRFNKTASVLAGASFGLAFSYLIFHVNIFNMQIRWASPMAVLGGPLEIRIGYFVWAFSHFLLLVATILIKYADTSFGKEKVGQMR